MIPKSYRIRLCLQGVTITTSRFCRTAHAFDEVLYLMKNACLSHAPDAKATVPGIGALLVTAAGPWALGHGLRG